MSAGNASSSRGTPASSSIRLDALSREQLALLEEHRGRWNKLRLSTEPVDRARAEAGVALAYEAAGLSPPRRIAWCGGPIEMARAWEAARFDVRIGPNVRDQIVDKVRDRCDRDLAKLLGAAVRRALLERPRAPVDNVADEVVQIVARHARAASPNVWARMIHLLASLVRLRRPPRSWAGFGRSSISPLELGWLWPSWFVRECCDLKAETEQLRGLWLIATETGWVLPHQHVCWLAGRPSVLNSDARGRLHGARGPALAYPDGWSYHAWKGIEVAAELIEHPEAITVAAIDREPDPVMRRTMIDLVTPQRYVTIGGATRTAKDETGVLWRKTWWTGDTWAAVEVVNGTPEQDGTHRHYFLQVPPQLRTARAAVAWTYGMPEEQYGRLVERT